MTMNELMMGALERNASDIHLKVGNPPIYRIDGSLVRLPGDPLTEQEVFALLQNIATPADLDKFRKLMELDISYMLEGVARFRVNVCRDDGDSRIVLRVIPLKGDYTKQDPSIRKQLLAFGVNSVPLNLVYPAGRPEAIVHLPVILTPGIVSDALDKAGPSNKKPQDSPAP